MLCSISKLGSFGEQLRIQTTPREAAVAAATTTEQQ